MPFKGKLKHFYETILLIRFIDALSCLHKEHLYSLIRQILQDKIHISKELHYTYFKENTLWPSQKIVKTFWTKAQKKWS